MILSKEEIQYFKSFDNMIYILSTSHNIKSFVDICKTLLNNKNVFPIGIDHVDIIRKRNNNIQKTQYYKDVISELVNIISVENLLLYDKIIGIKFEYNIVIIDLLISSVKSQLAKGLMINEDMKSLYDTADKIYNNPISICENEKQNVITLIKYSILGIVDSIKHYYFDLLTKELHDSIDVKYDFENGYKNFFEKYSENSYEKEVDSLQSFFVYLKNVSNAIYKRSIINETLFTGENIEVEKEESTKNISFIGNEYILEGHYKFSRDNERYLFGYLNELYNVFNIGDSKLCKQNKLGGICAVIYDSKVITNCNTFSECMRLLCSYWQRETPKDCRLNKYQDTKQELLDKHRVLNEIPRK